MVIFKPTVANLLFWERLMVGISHTQLVQQHGRLSLHCPSHFPEAQSTRDCCLPWLGSFKMAIHVENACAKHPYGSIGRCGDGGKSQHKGQSLRPSEVAPSREVGSWPTVHVRVYIVTTG
jgi:hypothetical protein